MSKIASLQISKYILPGLLAGVLFVSSCQEEVKKPLDTLTQGNIEIAADETFRPVVQEELKVFDSSFPEGHITAHYKPESDCIKDFMEGKLRLILVTRELSKQEKDALQQQKIVTTSLAVAKDAVCIILNKVSEDTVLSVGQIKGILTGVYKKKYTAVFDNQGSSTLRYVMDSLLPGAKLGTNVFATKGADSVIDYVSKNPDAIGFVGMGDVSDYNDPEGLAFINKVSIAAIYNDSLEKIYKPYQAYIANGSYPLTRNLFYIHRETYPGLGTGFSNFLSRDRGQLIFKQARLFPLRTNIILREAAVNN